MHPSAHGVPTQMKIQRRLGGPEMAQLGGLDWFVVLSSSSRIKKQEKR